MSRQQRVAHQTDEAVCHENEVPFGSFTVPDNRVHPAHLERALHKVQIRISSQQHIAHQLALKMANNKVHSDQIVAPLPRDDDVSHSPTWCDEFVMGGLDKATVLFDDASHVSAAFCNVSFDSTRKARVIIRVHKDAHVRAL
jgi:hypothetical protein